MTKFEYRHARTPLWRRLEAFGFECGVPFTTGPHKGLLLTLGRGRGKGFYQRLLSHSRKGLTTRAGGGRAVITAHVGERSFLHRAGQQERSQGRTRASWRDVRRRRSSTANLFCRMRSACAAADRVGVFGCCCRTPAGCSVHADTDGMVALPCDGGPPGDLALLVRTKCACCGA